MTLDKTQHDAVEKMFDDFIREMNRKRNKEVVFRWKSPASSYRLEAEVTTRQAVAVARELQKRWRKEIAARIERNPNEQV